MSTADRTKLFRQEDLRLLTGRGQFIADLPLRPFAEVAVLRSPFAHARIESVDADEALEMPGVLGVLTGREVREFADPMPSVVRKSPPYYPLALEKVRFAGEAVAAVIAENRYVAEDALDQIFVSYDPLTAVVEPVAANQTDAPQLHADVKENCAWRRSYRYGDPDSGFGEADVVIRREFRFPAYSSIPLETYGVMAEYDSQRQEYVVHCNFQGPFSLHSVMAKALRVDKSRLRIVVPRDVGGSFGSKAMLYPYVVLMCLAARATGTRVRWIEDRYEHLISSSRGSDQHCELEVACKRDGELLALRTTVRDNVGAYLRAPEPATVVRTISNFQGPYRLRGIELDARAIVTNTMPTGLNRGYGAPQHFFAVERMMDELAIELEMDPVEIRKRNLIAKDRFPFRTITGGLYDSGDYQAALARALEVSRYARWRERQATLRDEGRLVGLGIACVVDGATSNMGYISLALEKEARAHPGYQEKSGNQDTAALKMDSSGRVSVSIATAGAGQSHETVAGQIVGQELGIDPDLVYVEDRLDTATSVWSVSSGSYSSRFAATVAPAVKLAAGRLKEKLMILAAQELECSVGDLEVRDGRISVRGVSSRAISLSQLAGTAHWNAGGLPDDLDPGLQTSATFSFPGLAPVNERDEVNVNGTYGFMADVAVVEVDKETGAVEILDYVSAHDAGTVLNPQIVEGQRRGAFVHGLAGALYEHMAYTSDGQPLAVTMADYLCPTAGDVPHVNLETLETPSPFTPLGAKGMADGSCTPAPIAIASAVGDALRHLGISVEELPLAPDRIWALIRG